MRPLHILAALVALGASASARSLIPLQDYVCDNGSAVEIAAGSSGQLHLTLGNRTVTLTRAVSADGERYVGGHLTWWIRGNTATFLPDARPPALTCRPSPPVQLGSALIISPLEEAPTPVRLSLGDAVTVHLPVQAGTGYRFVARGSSRPGVLSTPHLETSAPGRIGGELDFLAGYFAERRGRTTVRFDLLRPGGAVARTVLVQVLVR